MFGLVGACLAMYHTARPENRSKIKAILIPAAFTSFIAGVTEPIEFSFPVYSAHPVCGPCALKRSWNGGI